jgi:CBS domain-containing protein
MQCGLLMKSFVESISAQDSVEAAARLMRDRNIGFLPVRDELSDRVVGTVTDRDIAIRAVAEGKEGTMPVAAIMTREIVACSPEDDLRTAEELMGERLVSRIMCINDEGDLVGVISLSDLALMDGSQAAKTLEQVSAREASIYQPSGAPLANAHTRRR